MGRSTRRMGGGWRFGRRAKAGYESDRFRLMVLDREQKTTRELMPKFDRWVDEFVWDPSSEAFLFTSANAGEEKIYSVDMQTWPPSSLSRSGHITRCQASFQM